MHDLARRSATKASPEHEELPAADEGPQASPPVAGLAVHRLTVGSAHDAEEQRADEVAARVVEALASEDGPMPVAAHQVEDGQVRRSTSGDGGVIGAAGGELGVADSALIASRSGRGVPLGAGKERLSRAIGADLGAVRVHSGPEAKALNERMSSAAFTVGSDIYFRDGQPDLSTGPGRRIMAHELAHAVGADGAATAHRFGEGWFGGTGKTDTKKEGTLWGGFLALFGPSEEDKKREAAEKAQKELDAHTKDYAAVSALSLAELEKYAAQTPDWAKHSTMTTERPACISKLVAFAADPLSGACPFTVGDLLGAGNSTAEMTKAIASLSVYAKAVQNDPFSLDQAATVKDAIAIGTDLETLLGAFPRWVLAAAMNKATFSRLREAKAIDDVIAYFQGGTQHPIFQAANGRDFDAYLRMRTVDKVDPTKYQAGDLNLYIRNFHRFEARTLDRLLGNFKDTSKHKPLTLVLHSTLDHNGAFHREADLFSVVDSAMNNTLMIEGGETLDSYKSQITPLAQKYGKNAKIDQVMFAGHGNAQSMELAGTVREGKKGRLEESGEDLDVEDGATTEAKTEELFDEVLANMDGLPDLKDPKQPHRRLLLNACLTNSNLVDTDLTGDEDDARKEIRDWIAKNMSLATYLNDRAKKQGKDVTALGANASIGAVKLIDAGGGLDLFTAADPKVTSSKLEYAEHGKEPTGVLRAAVESFGNDADATLRAIKARIKATNMASFDDLIVRAVYSEFVDERDVASADPIDNLRIMAEYIEDFSHLQSATKASLKPLHGPLKRGWGRRLLDTVIKHSAEAKSAEQGLMIRTARLALDPTRSDLQAAVLAQLDDPTWTVKGAQVDQLAGRYLDIKLLDKLGALPDMLTGPATHGKLVLALAGQLSQAKPAACTAYLQGLRRPAVPAVPGLPAVPEVPPVPAQRAPRELVPAVPAAPGRPKVDKIGLLRKEYPAVADLAKLDELPAVDKPKDSKKVVTATGRAGRPARKAVDAVPEVEQYFDDALKIEALLGGASTVRHILKSL